jgi:hypothetical protein
MMHDEIGESCTSYASVNITTFTSVPLQVQPIPETACLKQSARHNLLPVLKSAAVQVALVVLGELG